MNARKRFFAARREEILGYLSALQRRRGLESTIELDLLAAILGAKFATRKKDMAWFICHVLTKEERAQFRILGYSRASEVKKEIDLLPVLTAKELRERNRLQAKEQVVREKMRRQEERNAKRLEREQVRARKIEQREAERQGRARLEKDLKARKDLLKAAEEQQRQRTKDQRKAQKPGKVRTDEVPLEAVLTANEKVRPPSDTRPMGGNGLDRSESTDHANILAAGTRDTDEEHIVTPGPAQNVKPSAEPKRTSHQDIGAMVQRAIRAIKGSIEVNNANVASRAAMYGDVSKERITKYVERLPKERRKELGFEDAIDKKKTGVSLRPRLSNVITKKIY